MSKKILVVDADRSLLLQLRNDLGQYRQKFTALLTENARAAVEAVRTQDVALIVAGSQLEFDGLSLPAYLFRQEVLTPVVLLAEPGQEASTDEASCVVRRLPRPVSSTVLAEEIQQVLANEALEGLLHGVSASSFFQFVEVEGKTCTISVNRSGDGDRGTLFFVKGRLLDAHYPELDGVAAALKILAWEKVDLAILNFCPLRHNRINRSIGSLLLDAAVAQDHAAAAEQGVELAPPLKHKPLLPLLQQSFAGREGVETVAEDTSWDDLLGLAQSLGKDLEVAPFELCSLSGLKDGTDLVVVPSTPPVALHVSRFANRDLVADKVLRLLEEA